MMGRRLIAASLIALGSAGAVHSENLSPRVVSDMDGCSCVAASSGDYAGMITSMNGDILISGQNGYEAAEGGQLIPANSRLMLGCTAQAQINVGTTCKLELQSGTEVDVVSADGKVCVRTLPATNACGKSTLSSSQSLHEDDHRFGLPEQIFLGTVLLGSLFEHFGSGDNPSSP